MQLKSIFAAMIVGLGLAGCAGKHVTFFPQVAEGEATDKTRVFLDARGHLYPRTGLPAEFDFKRRESGSLFEAAYRENSRLCSSAADGTEMRYLCDAFEDGCSWEICLENWEAAQEALWQSRAREIVESTNGKDNVVLVTLLHGFNNTYEESSPAYFDVERRLPDIAKPDQTLHFIEVFWDGCEIKWTAPRCWGRGQASGPLVGFSLRQLFNATEDVWPAGRPTPSHRFLSHSSGAFVAGALLGDPSAALPLLQDFSRNRRYELFAEHAQSVDGPYRLPRLNDAKLAMLAAATPSETFTGSENYPGGLLVDDLDLLIAVNPLDFAITKGGFGCKLVGVSCLGAKIEHVCRVAASLRDGGSNDVFAYDFLRDPEIFDGQRTDHAFGVYIRQADKHSSFFRDFLASRADSVEPDPGLNCT